MYELLRQAALSHGDRLQVIPAERLKDLREEIEQFRGSEELNGFQKWIITEMYSFDIPSTEFAIRSVILTAIPHPFYANTVFVRQGKKYNILCPVMPDFESTEKYLKDVLDTEGYHLIPAPELPLKRLAVKSGLAVYGRNNICYVDGLGSIFSFAAYLSDIPDSNNEWYDLHTADKCTNCRICLKSCPTGAIRENRFLIDNEKCLSYFNEVPGEFPEWLPLSVHHCLYDCLKCQILCPMNKEYVKNIIGPIEFSEEETQALLSGEPLEEFSLSFKKKAKQLGLDLCFKAVPRNMNILLDNYESN